MADGEGVEVEEIAKLPSNTARVNSCKITVVNNLDVPLVLEDMAHVTGGFTNLPGKQGDQIPPHTTSEFGSKDSPFSSPAGCEGSVIYSINTATFWTVHWINPDTAELAVTPSNQADSTLEGPEAGQLDTTSDVPELGDFDIPVTFTISGHKLTIDEYRPPGEVDQPTLRHGDQSVDGWVEYLQQLLNAWGHGPVAEDGNFEGTTHQAVIAFQQRKNAEGEQALVDGIVGNQTWALLRADDPRPASTDGRTPHSYVEAGPEARWWTEDTAFFYDFALDLLVITAVSTGDTAIGSDTFHARMAVTLPNSEPEVLDLPLRTGDGQPAGEGQLLTIEFAGARQRAGSGTLQFRVFLPEELGGDEIQGSVEI